MLGWACLNRLGFADGETLHSAAFQVDHSRGQTPGSDGEAMTAGCLCCGLPRHQTQHWPPQDGQPQGEGVALGPPTRWCADCQRAGGLHGDGIDGCLGKSFEWLIDGPAMAIFVFRLELREDQSYPRRARVRHLRRHLRNLLADLPSDQIAGP